MVVPLKEFYMIRHGQSVANRDKFISGNLDSPLTDLGKEQAELARNDLEQLTIKPRIIVHSHLSRAADTAKILNGPYNLPMQETPLLGEQKLGDWETQDLEEIRQKWRDGEDPPNGETQQEFAERIGQGITYALEFENPVLIVCHGGVFRAFHRLYRQAIPPVVANCKLYHFTPKEDDSDFPWKIQPVA